MKTIKIIPFLILIILTSSIFSFSIEKIKVKDLPEFYQKWLQEEVFYIITNTEKEVFLELQNNKERDLFIEAFWKQRDPTTGTEANELKIEHYRRLDHANRRFRGTGRPGWKSDRGKVYILLGEPKSQREYLASDIHYPAIQWDYQGLKGYGLPQGFHLIFYQKGRIGDYVLYNPGMEGPWSLLANPTGDPSNHMDAYYALDMVEPMLAKASISLIPGETVPQFPSMASAALIQNIDYSARKKVEDRYARKFMEYKDIVEVEYSTNYIDSNSFARIFQDYSGTSYVHFCIEPENISMGEYESNIYTRLELNGMLVDQAGMPVFQFDKSVPLNFTDSQYNNMRARPFNFYDIFPLAPGKYNFSLLLKNSVSKEFTSFEIDLSVPETIQSNQISPLLLGFNVQKTSVAPDQARPFIIESLQLYSQPGNNFIPKDKLYVFFQIMSPSADLLQNGSLKYTFYNGERIFSTVDFPLSKYPESINYLEIFPLEKFPAGYYRLKVALIDSINNKVIAAEEKFQVAPLTSIPRPWVFSRSLLEAGQPEVDYILGRQFLSQDKLEKARSLLEKAYRKVPNDLRYAQYMAQVYFKLAQYQAALDILEPILEQSTEDYDVFYLTAQVYQQMGQYDKAIQHLNEAIDKFGINTTLLNAVGNCYIKAGDIPSALTALEKSLEIDSTQTKIKELIESIK